MRDLIGSLCEARKKAQILTATKARNAIVKAAKSKGFSDASAVRSYPGMSNPYSGTQELNMTFGDVDVSKASAKKVEDALKAAGFVIKKAEKSKQNRRRYSAKERKYVEGPADYWSISAESPDDPSVHVSVYGYSRSAWTVRIFGPKKAKATTIPYYD